MESNESSVDSPMGAGKPPETSSKRLHDLAKAFKELLSLHTAMVGEFETLGFDPNSEKFPLFIDRLADDETGLEFAQETLDALNEVPTAAQGPESQVNRILKCLAKHPEGLTNANIIEKCGLESAQVARGLYLLRRQGEARKSPAGLWIWTGKTPSLHVASTWLPPSAPKPKPSPPQQQRLPLPNIDDDFDSDNADAPTPSLSDVDNYNFDLDSPTEVADRILREAGIDMTTGKGPL